MTYFTPSVDFVVQYRRQVEYLTGRYAVVVTNPPYMGSKNMSADLAAFAKREYPDTKSDLFAMFIQRCLELTTVGGQLGFMTPYVWMFIKTYEPPRRILLANETITSLIQLEYSGFDGATVPICAFSLQRGSTPTYDGGYVRLADFVGPKLQAPKALEAIQDQTNSWFYRAKSADFAAIPGSPIVYWLSEKMRAAFTKGKPLGEVASPAVGLQTGANDRFVRQWWEVGSTRTAFTCTSRDVSRELKTRWFPYNKGGEYRKWYGNQEHVVNWENDGAEIRVFGTEDGGRPRSRAQNTETFFMPSVSYSDVISSENAFRLYPAGFIHDSTGHSIFGIDSSGRSHLLSMLNSSVIKELIKTIAPTLHLHVGYLAKLPVLRLLSDNLDGNVDTLVTCAKGDWDDAETSWEYTGDSLVRHFRS